MIYIWNSAFFALSAWNWGRICFFSRRGRRLRGDFRYCLCCCVTWVCSAFFALSAWNRERSCAFFHAEVADYAEIFGTVFAVAGLVASFATTEAAEAGMTGSVLVSRRDWHDMIYIWNSAFFALFAWNRGRICAFFTQRPQITRRYSVLSLLLRYLAMFCVLRRSEACG